MRAANQDTYSFLQRYSIERKHPDSDQTVLREKYTNNYVLMKTINVATHAEFKTIIQTLQNQKGLKNQHLLSLIQYQSQTEQTCDVVFHRVICFYEYSSHNLEQQIQSRIKEGRYFEESQLWSILCSCVFGLAYLQRENIGHGCVSPLDIFLTSDGLIKIVDPSIATSSPMTIEEGYYYSPQILDNGFDEQMTDIFKSDIFSLGICLLHAAFLQPQDDLYDYEHLKISIAKLKKRLNNMREQYSEELINFISNMVNTQPDQRSTFFQLQQDLVLLLNKDSLENSSQINPNTLSEQFLTMISQKQIHQFSSQASYNEHQSPLEPDRQDKPNQKTLEPSYQKDDSNIDEEQVRQKLMNYCSIKNSQMIGSLDISKESEKIQIEIQPPHYLHQKFSDEYQPPQIFYSSHHKSNSQSLISNANTSILIQNMYPNITVTMHNKENKYSNVQSYPQKSKNNSQVYTDPALLNMMRADMERILSKSKISSNLQYNIR